MRKIPWALALAFPLAFDAAAQEPPPDQPETSTPAPVKTLGVVTVSAGQPTSLPAQIPTTIEGVTREQIEATVNATDSEDALKYLPSLLVRKRYVGDYNHAVLSSRASGTGNSARSAVYADGILLSNYLGNGATYAPRWGLVTPEEIERVDVMYGPFSAAYAGNSVGAVVDYVTRMPTKLEAHVKGSTYAQPFRLYNSSETYSGSQLSASLGNRSGDWAWWINLNRTDSSGQPLVFATRNTPAGAAGTPVTGAVSALDRTNTPWLIFGTTTQYHTLQDHAKIKLAYDMSPTLRASYTLGNWRNTAEGNPQTYLRDAAGNPVYGGTVSINGVNYNASGLFNATREQLDHVMHGLSLKSNTQGLWDWELAASLYDYGRDLQRRATVNAVANLTGGAGTLIDQKGTGWSALAAKGIWRPQGVQGAHIVDVGVQQDNYQLRILTSSISGNWLSDDAGALASDVGGRSQLQSVYAQDSWAFAPRWKTVLGARVENWTAAGGYARTSTLLTNYEGRNEIHVSPKAALAYQWAADLVLKGSVGRAVRMPTVQELYGSTTTLSGSYVNNPHLRPEKSWTTELSAEKDLGKGLLRFTLFNEDVTDALYTQFIPSTTTNSVQNVDAINTKGVELVYQGGDVWLRGLDFSGSVTYADSRIVSNPAFPASIGKYQPRVPVWRATALLSYRWDPQLSTTLAVRYSGDQYSTLDNSDVNGFAYMAASRYLVADVRAHYKVDKRLSAAFGIDNLGNETYWNFHPYPQRTYVAELKYDY